MSWWGNYLYRYRRSHLHRGHTLPSVNHPAPSNHSLPFYNHTCYWGLSLIPNLRHNPTEASFPFCTYATTSPLYTITHLHVWPPVYTPSIKLAVSVREAVHMSNVMFSEWPWVGPRTYWNKVVVVTPFVWAPCPAIVEDRSSGFLSSMVYWLLFGVCKNNKQCKYAWLL